MLTSDPKADNGWFDSHCHLNDLDDPAASWRQAVSAGIRHCLIPGTHPDQWAELDALCTADIRIAKGTHPWFVQEPEQDVAALQQALETQRLTAVGEIGLDFFNGRQPRPEAALQTASFSGQLELAARYHRPVVIHAVKSHQQIVRHLKQVQPDQGVVHAFVGPPELARQYLDLGFYLGIGPQLMRSEKLQRTVRYAPIDRLVLETDAPYMAIDRDAGHPLLDLLTVAARVSELTSEPLAGLQQQMMDNTRSLFNL